SGILLKISSDVEEKSKESLEDIYEKYRLVALNSSDLIAFTTADFDLIFTFANPSYKKILGYENEELLGRSGLSFIHNDDKKHIVQMLLTFLDSRKNDGLSKEKAKFTHNIDFRFLDKSGQWHFLQSTIDIVNGEFLIISKDITEQKHEEEKLHRSEEMFSKAFRLSPESITLTSLKEGRYVDVNESFLHVIGYSRDEVIGRTATELNIWVDPDDRARFIQGLKEQGCIRNLEIRMRTKSGGVGTVLMSSEIITINGEPCALTVTTNITDRKRSEETLRENEQRMKSIIQGLSIAAFVIDSNHQVLYWNKALEELSNIRAEEIIGTTNHWKAFYTQKRPCMADILIDGGIDDIQKWYAGRYKKSSLLDESFEATDFFPNLGNDGKWLRFTATVIRNTNGDLISILETLEDISERKKAEEALRETGERFRLAISSITDILYEWNIKTGSMQWFGKIDSLMGYENGTFPRTIDAFLKHIHPEDVNNVKEVATNGLKSHQKWQGAYRVINKEGTELYWSGAGIGVYDQEGNPVKVVGAVTDITKRKREEEALAQQNEALSQLSRFSIELSMLSSEDNLEAFIIKRIKEIAGAEVAMFSDYNSTNRTTTTKHIEIEPGLLEKVVSLLGTQVTKIHSVITDEMYQQMTTEIIGFQKTLHEVSLGAISRPVGAAIQALLKVDRFIGLAYIINGKLYGTSILGMKKGQPDPPKQILENFIFMAAVSLRRKQAEEELRRSEEQYRLVTDNASDIIWTMDLNLRFTYFSPSNEKLTGYTTEKALTLSLDELLTPESVERALQAFTAQMDLENNPEKDLFRSVTLELNEKRVDGTIFPVEVRMCFLRDAQNNPVGILGITRDITERKATEVVLATSERRYRSLYNNLRDGSAAVDLQGKIIECNNAFENMLGYSREELKSITFEEITPMKWHDIEKKILEEQVIRRGYSDLYEKEYRHKDGKIFPVELQTYVIRDDENQLCGFWAFIRDVTVRKQMELAQKESEEKYRSIVENTQDVIMLTAPDGRVSYISPACVRVLEYNPDELVGKIPEIFYPDDVEKIHNALSSAMQGVSGSNLEYRIRTKNGKTKWVSHSWSPILTENHELQCIVSIVRDITESKIAEQTLKMKIEELEKYKSVTVNREVKMVDLKKEINELCSQLNQKPKYPSV
ncbi:MAG TPA: PAS domain S-box protein, partial [Candidatus Thermoplasmatota archaeon]|nr:PAS domain S-box protein [Candidatus Thermoplasmatota archaeon]